MHGVKQTSRSKMGEILQGYSSLAHVYEKYFAPSGTGTVENVTLSLRPCVHDWQIKCKIK